MQLSWDRFIKNVTLRRSIVLILIIAVLYLMRSEMNMILFTFILTYIVVHWVRLIQRHFPKVPTTLTVILTYVLIIALVYLAVTMYLPIVVRQIIKVVSSLMHYYQHHDVMRMYHWVSKYVSTGTIMSQTKRWVSVAVKALTNFGTLAATFFISLILSFFYTVQIDRMNSFSHLFLTSRFSWFFQDIAFFGRKFVNTFGVVLEAQLMIAICNTAITTICLILMKFPQIFALSLMIFVLSLIPVAGVIISLIPLCLIGYTVGGVRDVVYVVIMIICIHCLESYVLNPHFMSSKTELPIFYTFIILLISEHLFGIWGLIVGVPIFTFFLDILGVKEIGKKSDSSKTRTINN